MPFLLSVNFRWKEVLLCSVVIISISVKILANFYSPVKFLRTMKFFDKNIFFCYNFLNATSFSESKSYLEEVLFLADAIIAIVVNVVSILIGTYIYDRWLK